MMTLAPYARLASCLIASGLIAAALTSCGPSEKKQVKKAEPAVLRDVPDALRGTIGAEAAFRGVEPTLVSGLGVVVGLNGTGGGELPQSIMTTMEREVARNGIGKGGAVAETSLGPMTPQEFLRSPDVAVVIVEARIAPGAPEGSNFDVFVRTLPGSSVTSLEGGTLWTTELRIGPAAVFGAVKTRKIAEARGPVFINPFSDSGAASEGSDVSITRTRGRVLNGGTVTDPLLIEMVLDNDSHTRARSIVAAINSKFPREAGDEGATARGRGRSGAEESAVQSIALRVPRAYKDRPAEFLQIVRAMRVDSSMPQEYARQYVETLKQNPGMAGSIRWMLQALGKPALPFMASMYDYPEFNPRMAALAAGARLGDPRATTPLLELARSGPPGLRTDAIRLLADMPRDPAINLGSKELDVRVAAYEALRKRRDPIIAQAALGGTIERPDFVMELVPKTTEDQDSLIYITQQGEPRVVLFGGLEPKAVRARDGSKFGGIKLNRPMLTSAFGDRLLLSADSLGGQVRLRYTSPKLAQVMTLPRVPEDLGEFIEFLARKTGPEEPRPGLGLTYSEVVTVLYELSKQGGVSAAFATEEDRLRAEIFEAARTTMLTDRPEGEAQLGPDATVFAPVAPGSSAAGTGAAAKAEDRGTRVIPLTKPRARVD
jgi:flagellar basal body P-ring protein FlgI